MGERRLRRKGTLRQRTGAVVALSAMLAIALAIAGCGASATPAGAGSGTPQATQQCGTVQRGGPLAGTPGPHDGEALACFWHAYSACSPATLVYITSGVDATATHTFTVESKAAGCAVSDRVHTWINTMTRDYDPVQCAGVRQLSDGLTFDGCGVFGDVTIAAG